MERLLLFTLSILFIILGMNPAVRAGTNVWTSIGPDGGRVQAIAVDPQNPDTVYAVAGGAIFKTTDGAANWKLVYSGATTDGKVYYPAFVVVVNPQDSNTVYVGAGNGGVFKSTDGAASWSLANAGLPKPDSIFVDAPFFVVGLLAIDPWNPETIYAGISGGPVPSTSTPSLFKSTDGGAS